MIKPFNTLNIFHMFILDLLTKYVKLFLIFKSDAPMSVLFFQSIPFSEFVHDAYKTHGEGKVRCHG